MGVYYYALLTGFVLITISWIALVYQVKKYNVTDNISYNFIAMNSLSAIMLLVVSLFSGYFIHSAVFAVFLVLTGVLGYYKVRGDKFDVMPEWITRMTEGR